MTDTIDLAETIEPFDLAPDPGRESDEGYVRNGRYYLPDPDGAKKPLICTRATTWAKTVSDTFTLNQWGLRMALKGVALAPSLMMRVAVVMNQQLPPSEEKAQLQPLAEEAKNIAAAREPAEQGTAFHALAEQEDTGLEPYVPEPYIPSMIAYKTALAKECLAPIPALMERIVLCRQYKVAGKFDRILQGRPCAICGRSLYIGDVKTGRDLQYGWNEISVQLGIYANADLILDHETDTFSVMPEVCKHDGWVMHVPIVGSKGVAWMYRVDLEAGWYGSELTRMVRDWRGRGDLAEPTQCIEVLADGGEYRTIDHMITWEERIATAPTVGELRDIWKAARKVRQWTDALEKLAKERQKVLEPVAVTS